jgi:uncharacterized protein YdhG (YjbR/CyaY superfamily)
MKRPGFASVDDYIAAQPAPGRAALRQVRAIIRKALPGVTEGISYQIPVYKLGGVMVLFFAGFQRHYSIYPASARLVSALGKAIAGAVHRQATIRFSLDEPVPTRLVARIAKLRAVEVGARRATKTISAKSRAKTPAAKPAASKPKSKSAAAHRRRG